jgi:hypothetical protein
VAVELDHVVRAEHLDVAVRALELAQSLLVGEPRAAIDLDEGLKERQSRRAARGTDPVGL